MTLLRNTIWTLALVSLCGTAKAERSLTLKDALAISKQNNYDLRAARSRLDQARVGTEQARTALLPVVSAQGKYTRNNIEAKLDLAQQNAAILGFADAVQAGSSGNPALVAAIDNFKQQLIAATPKDPIVIQKQDQLDFTASATVPLVVPYGYVAYSGAKRAVEAADANYNLSETTVLFQTAQAFYAAAGADELLNARKHGIEVASKTLNNAKARLAAGVVNRVEVKRAEVALLRVEQAAREAADVQAQAYRSLQTILQVKEPIQINSDQGASAKAAAEANEDIPALKKQALMLRPEYRAYEKNEQASITQAKSFAWRYAPTISGFGLLRAFNYPGFTQQNYAWAIGAQIDWLIYDGGIRDANRHLAEAQARENRFRLELLRSTIADEIDNAKQQLDTKRIALKTAESSAVLGKEALDLIRVQYDAGTATQLDLLQAQDTLIGAEVAVAQARFDLALGEITLKRATGQFPANSL